MFLIPLDWIVWAYVLLIIGLPEEKPQPMPPPVTHPAIARWELPGFRRVDALTRQDVESLNAPRPIKMDGRPMGVPNIPLDVFEALFGEFPPFNRNNYRYPHSMWFEAVDAPGVYLVFGRGRVAVPNYLTTKPWPLPAGTGDSRHRSPAMRALIAHVTAIMAARGETWP